MPCGQRRVIGDHDVHIEQIEEKLNALSPRGFMGVFHIRFSRPLRRCLSFPTDWMATYTRENLIAADPAAIWGIRNTGTIRWSQLEAETIDPLRVFAQARAHGLRFGLTVAVGPERSRSICGFARDDREFTPAEATRIEALVQEAHDALAERHELRPILLAALDAIACGMTYDRAAAHLGISRTALRYRLTTAQKALGADDTQDAIRRAMDAGLISSQSFTGISAGLPLPAHLPAGLGEAALSVLPHGDAASASS